jgi:hypothetical protein
VRPSPAGADADAGVCPFFNCGVLGHGLSWSVGIKHYGRSAGVAVPLPGWGGDRVRLLAMTAFEDGAGHALGSDRLRGPAFSRSLAACAPPPMGV